MNFFILLVSLIVFLVGMGGIFLISQVVAEPTVTVNLSNTNEKSHRAQMFAFDNNIYVVWQDDSSGKGDIFFSRSTNSGVSFDSVINLSDNAGTSAFPRLAYSGENVYATWYDYSPGLSDIFFAKSTDEGASFETINLSKNAGVSFNPWIAASGSNVYVVWNDDTDPTVNLQRNSTEENITFDVSTGNSEIFMATSHDDGSTFEIINLSNTTENSIDTRINVSKNNVYVVWNEKNHENIFLVSSTNSGASFSEAINVSNSDNTSRNAGIKTSRNNVHIIWLEVLSNSTHIFYAKSENNGQTFGSPINLSIDSIGPNLTRDTQMAISGDNVYVVWYENTPNSSGVFFVRSMDAGTTFTKPINLSGATDKILYAQIEVHENSLYVIWNDKRFGNTEVFLRQSDDGGNTFGSIQNLSSDDTESNLFVLGPQIAVTDEHFFIIYENEHTEGSDLFVKRFDKNTNSQLGTLSLQSINEAVNVEMGISQENLEPDTPIEFSLKFTNPTSGVQLENVNYSFKIVDVSGNELVNRLNQHTQDGFDIQSVTFSKTGPLTIMIDIQGLGKEQPFSTKYSGDVSAVITVVPEFPILFVVLVLAMLASLLLAKFMGYQSVMQKTLQTN
ncbi:MAG TPA: sialidase family protein [Nitrosopumilaceae archaeon]|nr:sialidase family protein [Nitrosopumilaceae archaeon]